VSAYGGAAGEGAEKASGSELRSKLERGGQVLGVCMTMRSESVLEVLAGAGYDCVVLDCQHGALFEADAVAFLRRFAAVGTDILVRVSSNSPALIGKVLDAGADGVIVPLVDTAAEARAAVAACRYRPAGDRSFGPIRGDLPRTPGELEERASCFVMIESAEGVENAAEIAAVRGVDGVVVGPADLSISLGLDPIEGFTTDQIFEPLAKVRAACEHVGIATGIFAADATDVPKWTWQGVRMVIAGSDLGLLGSAAAAAVATGRRPSPRVD
jgi:4-hydroxy-2-oxoheptanedioate aldolase